MKLYEKFKNILNLHFVSPWDLTKILEGLENHFGTSVFFKFMKDKQKNCFLNKNIDFLR